MREDGDGFAGAEAAAEFELYILNQLRVEWLEFGDYAVMRGKVSLTVSVMVATHGQPWG